MRIFTLPSFKLNNSINDLSIALGPSASKRCRIGRLGGLDERRSRLFRPGMRRNLFAARQFILMTEERWPREDPH